jgi:hypothetical protein
VRRTTSEDFFLQGGNREDRTETEKDDERKAGKKNKGMKDRYVEGDDNVSYRVASFFYAIYTRGRGVTPLSFVKLAGFGVLTAATTEVSEKYTASIFMLEKLSTQTCFLLSWLALRT